MNSIFRIDSYVLTTVFGLIGVLLLLIIARTLRKWNASDSDPFAIRDLLMENGKASKAAFVLMGAFALSSWFIFYYALNGKMTELYFGAYLTAWVAPVVTRLITNAPSSTIPPATTTMTTTETKSA